MKKLNYGVHVGSIPALETNLEKCEFTTAQIFVYVPLQVKRQNINTTAVRRVVRERDMRIYVHSSYLISPWGAKPYNIALSVDQLEISKAVGARGVIFHIPKLTPRELVPRFKTLISKKPAGQLVYLENRALRPDRASYETPEKINELVKTFINSGIAPSEINLCIDTAHLFASRQRITTYRDAQMWLSALAYPQRIRVLHLNGSRSRTYRDIHNIAFGARDLVWGQVSYRASGARAFIEYAKKYKWDVIVECDYAREHDELMRFVRHFTR